MQIILKLLPSLGLFLLFNPYGFAQCNTNTCTVPVPAVNAQDACILPNPQALNCYYGATTPDLPQSFPPSWCTDIDNNHWFAFTANSPVAVFTFTVFGCTFGNGIQVGVYSTTDCVNFQTIAPCIGIGTVTSYTLIAGGLSIGQVYYLCIDGTAGALCEYAINGSSPYINVAGSPAVCIPSDPTVNYTTGGVSSWSINPPSAGMILGNPVSNFVAVEWLQPGMAEICAQNVACPNAPIKCIDVLVGGGETEQQVSLCEGETVTCAGEVYNAPGVYEVHFNTGTNCDSTVRCFVNLVPKDTSNQKITLCGPTAYPLCDTSFTVSGVFSRTCTSSLGCDSVSILDLAILQPNAVIAQPDTLSCEPGAVVTLHSNLSSPNLALGGITDYQWTGPGIVGPDSLETVQVNQPGQYCLILRHGRDSVFCSDTVCVNVLGMGTLPVTPQIFGNPNPCANTSEVYTVLPGSLPLPASYIWTTTGNITFTALSSDSIFVNWPDSGAMGQICVAAIDTCGTSPTACILFNVLPASYNRTAQICEGESLLLGGALQTISGVYVDTLQNMIGCDSIVRTTLSVLEVDSLFFFQNTCDPANAGTFIITLLQVNGCDSVIINTIDYSPADTSLLFQSTCAPAAAGIFTQNLINQFGCDSTVITTVSLMPTDTTLLFGTSCNPMSVGVFTQYLSNQFGCDSTIITTTVFSQADTTLLLATSCDPGATGVFTQNLSNQFGCDSLVVTTVSLLSSDTTLLFGTSCDPAATGVFTQNLSNQFGCDSLVVTTVSLLSSDTTLFFGTSCDPTATGVFTQNLSNQFGCDSLVVTTVSLLMSDSTLLFGTSCDPTATGVFTQNLSNQFGCDSLVVTTVSLLSSDTTLLFGSSCDPTATGVFTQNLSNQSGCDSLVVTTVSLLVSDTTLLFGTSCDPTATGVFTQNLSNQFGCDSTVISTVTLANPVSNSLIISNYNGFGVSCPSGMDGVAQAIGNGGIGPYSFNWSNGGSTAEINGLAAGVYNVTVTDANSCSSTASVLISAPDTLAFSFIVNGLGCFDTQSGSIVVEAQGGVLPYRYSLGNGIFQDSPVFNNLDAGTYTVTTMDANGCQQTEIILVNAAIPLEVDLGEDQTIDLGGSTQLQAIVNLPIDSILSVAWTPPNDDLECPNCLEFQVAPFISTTYSVQVTALNGCSGTDNITVFVDRSRYLFVPNVFSPNEDGQNDRFGLFPKPGTVRRFKSFQIFDRWGDQVFAYPDYFTPADNITWDGFFKGRAMNPGVFVWTVEVEFVDGVVEAFQGDVTLVR